MARRILILANMFSPNVGGLETHLDDLCAYLDNKKHKAWVIAYQPLTTRLRAKHIERRGTVEIHRISWFGHGLFYKLNSRPILEFAYMFPGLFIYALFFMLRNAKEVDIIHAQGVIPSCVAWILNVIFKKRMVMSTHSIYDVGSKSLMSNLFKWILCSFDAILCLSNISKEELVRMGIDADKIRVFTYWVDQSIFRPLGCEECKKKLGWEGMFVALFVGRLVEEKGVRVLLEASQVLRDHDKIIFTFIGEGPLAEDLIKASSLCDNIKFIGPVNNDLLPVYHSAADVVVVPSTSQEGYGRVILEALSCGTPVIGAKRGGILEAIDASVGSLVEPVPEEIVRATLKLSGVSKEELNNIRATCLNYARDRFSSNNAEVILKAYESG